MFEYCPEPAPSFFEEGATAGTLVLWSGEPGPAIAISVVAITDGDGAGFIEPTGDPQRVTVTAD